MHQQGAEGVEGNARLTGAIGLVLLIALFIEGITILSIRGLITLHIFLGLLLIPPTLLKVASTAYRLVRYYRHAPTYVLRGAPPPLLRWTAPLLILLTAAVLATGVALLAVRPGQPGLLLTAHQVTFFVWFGLTAVHVLGHVKQAAVLSFRDWWLRGDRSRPRGRGHRNALEGISVMAGVALGASLLPLASSWTNRTDFDHHHPPQRATHEGQAPGKQPAPNSGLPSGR